VQPLADYLHRCQRPTTNPLSDFPRSEREAAGSLRSVREEIVKRLGCRSLATMQVIGERLHQRSRILRPVLRVVNAISPESRSTARHINFAKPLSEIQAEQH